MIKLSSLVSRNVAFNALGKFSHALLMFVFVPVLVGILGAESWGVIGFVISLTAITSILDLGLGATLSREIARHSVDSRRRSLRAELVYSYEIPLLLMAGILAFLGILLAEPIASQWLRENTLSTSELTYSLRLAAPTLGFQLITAMYNGALLGLQKQLVSNVLRVAHAVALYGGATLVLLSADPATVSRFFEWQLLCAGIYALCLRFTLYRALAQSSPLRWRLAPLIAGKNFAFGVAGTSALVICLTQADKLILSKIVSLETFGAYMLAVTLTSVQVLLVEPIRTAVYPQLTLLLERHDTVDAGATFLRWSRVVSVMIYPLAALLIAMPAEVAELWLSDPVLADQIAGPVRFLALGSLFNGLCTLPYALQLASGWATLGMYSNLIAVLLMIPGLLLLAPEHGMLGAAWIWALLNAGYVLIQIPIMFSRLLTEFRRQWYRDALIFPAVISAVLFLPTFIMTGKAGLSATASLFCGVAAAITSAAAIAARAWKLEKGSV